jgi:putative glutamine amidotransferase
MRSRRPLIGITVGSISSPGQRARYGTDQAYVRSIQDAGGNAVLLPPRTAAASVILVGALDGLMLTGGADVDPATYGQERRPETNSPDPIRDAAEIALVRRAVRLGLPILAICRGQQVLNVALGGDLFQDIVAEGASEVRHDVRDDGRGHIAHPVEVDPGSWLANTTGARSLMVNSLHHQAVRRVARGLRVTATSPDGIIEGLESPSRRVVAVQSHPEELGGETWARRLFRGFVAAARA